jgi:hypothetical protein
VKKYDIVLRATIEIGGEYEANSAEEARAAAELELRSGGQIGDITVERCIYLDEPDPSDLPSEAYDPGTPIM